MYNEKNTQYNEPLSRYGLSFRSENGVSSNAYSHAERSSRSRISQERLFQNRSAQAPIFQSRADQACRPCPDRPDTSNNACDCSTSWGLRDHPLAMVYSPHQVWRNIYKEDTALDRGTMFAELDLPFEGGKHGRN